MIKNMANATSHRGPDNTSFLQFNDCYLAHNRLSIIDLSSDGNQPMQSKNLSIVFNGEIYNYKEIRLELQEKGYKFNTKSDTEVILVAYREWGDLCVLKFVGMWAFAIYNSDTKNLFCSRDRFGIKPFYYIHEGNMFYFSSEVKALKKTKIFSNNLNETQISKAIQLGWIHDDELTMFEKVKQLGQATNLNFTNERIIKTKYWNIIDKKIKDDDTENLVHLFKEQLLSSLKFHVRSDVPIAATLSGVLTVLLLFLALFSKTYLKRLKHLLFIMMEKET
ncbi:MAG: hypothetical protein IPN86_24100 [Saprospiraceae bacterium]|nr:hypothetical protein [Saprospiraceae bacterium]